MTYLSEYLRAERPDHTEPASFYRPGAVSWEDREWRLRLLALVEDLREAAADEIGDQEA